MKKTILLAICTVTTLVLSSCSNGSENKKEVSSTLAENNITANNPDAQNPEPVLTFKHTDWDFGKIHEGEKVRHIYRFTNDGNEDLVIRSCKASCGCTVPNWDQRPIAPGETGKIEVAFDSKGKPGNQAKNVTVTANTNPPTTVLTFKATVLTE